MLPWLLILLLAGAGVFKAVADALAHGSARLTALGPWWDYATSWQRKYKDYYAGDKRPRFWGSSTVFVGLSDAWHCANLLSWACADAAFLLAAFPAYRWYAVTAVLARRLVFEPLYSWLRK